MEEHGRGAGTYREGSRAERHRHCSTAFTRAPHGKPARDNRDTAEDRGRRSAEREESTCHYSCSAVSVSVITLKLGQTAVCRSPIRPRGYLARTRGRKAAAALPSGMK